MTSCPLIPDDALPAYRGLCSNDRFVERFEIESYLQCGSTGVVFLARQRASPSRKVAVKAIRGGGGASLQRQLLAHEDRVFSHLGTSTGLVALEYEDVLWPYLVMLHNRGQLERTDLLEHLLDATLPLEAVMRLAVDLLENLETLHLQGIVHRDLRPQNLFVHEQPPGRTSSHARWTLVIGDFGLSKWGNVDVPIDGADFDLTYSAPHVRRLADVTVADDVYSAAAIIFTMFTARTPSRHRDGWESDGKALCERRVPPAVIDALMRALCRSELGRPGSAVELLGAFRDGAGTRGRGAPTIERADLTFAGQAGHGGTLRAYRAKVKSRNESVFFPLLTCPGTMRPIELEYVPLEMELIDRADFTFGADGYKGETSYETATAFEMYRATGHGFRLDELPASSFLRMGRSRRVSEDGLLALPGHLLLHGPAGCGKSTLMRRLACLLADVEGAPVPILVEAASLPGEVTMQAFVEHFRAHLMLLGLSQHLAEEILDGKLPAMLLLDGVDQNPGAWRFARELARAEREGFRIIATSRPEVALGFDDHRWGMAYIAGVGRHAAETLLLHAAPESPALRAKLLSRQMASIARTPVTLLLGISYLLRTGAHDKMAPTTTSVYDTVIAAVLRGEIVRLARPTDRQAPSEVLLRDGLSALAKGALVDRGDLILRREDIERELLGQLSVLLIESGCGQWMFCHLTVAEYFAARALVQARAEGLAEVRGRLQDRAFISGWIVPFYAGLLARDAEPRAKALFDEFVSSLRVCPDSITFDILRLRSRCLLEEATSRARQEAEELLEPIVPYVVGRAGVLLKRADALRIAQELWWAARTDANPDPAGLVTTLFELFESSHDDERFGSGTEPDLWRSIFRDVNPRYALDALACIAPPQATDRVIREALACPTRSAVVRQYLELHVPFEMITSMARDARSAQAPASQRLRFLSLVDATSSVRASAEVVEFLEDPDPEVRSVAALLLARLNARHAVGTLQRYLECEDPTIRECIEVALASLGHDGATKLLPDLLSSTQRRVRWNALSVIQERALRDAIPGVWRLAIHGSVEDTERALWVLGTLGDHSVASRLCAVLRHDQNRAGDQLSQEYGDESPIRRVRIATIRTLALLRDAASIEVMIPLLAGEDEELGLVAADAIGEIADRGIGAAILERRQEREIKPAEAVALARIGAREAREHIVTIVESRPPLEYHPLYAALASLDRDRSPDPAVIALHDERTLEYWRHRALSEHLFVPVEIALTCGNTIALEVLELPVVLGPSGAVAHETRESGARVATVPVTRGRCRQSYSITWRELSGASAEELAGYIGTCGREMLLRALGASRYALEVVTLFDEVVGLDIPCQPVSMGFAQKFALQLASRLTVADALLQAWFEGKELWRCGGAAPPGPRDASEFRATVLAGVIGESLALATAAYEVGPENRNSCCFPDHQPKFSSLGVSTTGLSTRAAAAAWLTDAMRRTAGRLARPPAWEPALACRAVEALPRDSHFETAPLVFWVKLFVAGVSGQPSSILGVRIDGVMRCLRVGPSLLFMTCNSLANLGDLAEFIRGAPTTGVSGIPRIELFYYGDSGVVSLGEGP